MYVQGLFLDVRSNCSAMALIQASKTNYQRLHHLINQSKWEFTELEEQVTNQFVDLVTQVGMLLDLTLIIDESGFSKKGHKSAGVARQYNGNIGKTDNCQVGVFGALNAGSITNIIKAKLYKPKEGISKIDHAKSIIYHVIKTLKIKVQCVCFIHFMTDLPESHKIILEPFIMKIPKSISRGRKHTKPKPDKPAIALRDYYYSLNRNDFKTLTIRHTTKGKLKAKFHRTNVYVWDSVLETRVRLTLLIRLDQDGKVYYSLTNYSNQMAIGQMAYKQCKRYFVERSFQDTKQSLGMSQYECRSELAWNKHISICMLAQLFANKEKVNASIGLLNYFTFNDIKNIIVAVILFDKSNRKIRLKQILDKSLKTKSTIEKLIYLRI
jgi:SRSO17 transposase